MFFDDWVEAPIYWRDDVPINQAIEGPAIIEEYGSTIIIPPGWKALVGNHGEVRMNH
nr:hypothetical protein [Vulcanisaeta sp. JCM 16159]